MEEQQVLTTKQLISEANDILEELGTPMKEGNRILRNMTMMSNQISALEKQIKSLNEKLEESE